MNDYISVCYGDDVLVHHGIKGQKWGVRRFQNEDGTRTEAGQRRYSTKSGKNSKTHKMNDEQLTRETNRLNRENQYLQATKNRKQNAKSDARIMGEQIAKALLTTAISAIVTSKVKTYAPLAFDAGVNLVKNKLSKPMPIPHMQKPDNLINFPNPWTIHDRPRP